MGSGWEATSRMDGLVGAAAVGSAIDARRKEAPLRWKEGRCSIPTMEGAAAAGERRRQLDHANSAAGTGSEELGSGIATAAVAARVGRGLGLLGGLTGPIVLNPLTMGYLVERRH